MKPICVAQLGIGHAHSQTNFQSFCTLTELYRMKGFCLCEGDEEKYQRERRIYDVVPRMTVEEILNDPEIEAVTVEAEEMYGTRYAMLAAEHGKHVFLDKPGGVSQSEFEALVRLMEKNGLKLHLGYMYRYNPAFLRAMELVESGTLGEIYAVEAHMDGLSSPELRQWLSNFPGGQLYFLGCHLIDCVLRIQGEPEEVIPLSMPTGLEGVTGEDYGMAAFRYPHGVSFVKTCSREPGGFMRRQLIVCGSKGTVEIQPFEMYVPEVEGRNHACKMRVTYEDDPAGWTAQGEQITFGPYNRYQGMARAFADEINGLAVNPYTPEYEITLHKLLLRACGVPQEELK